jgi:hypothetical protein
MPDMSWNKSAPLNRHELFLAETTAWLETKLAYLSRDDGFRVLAMCVGGAAGGTWTWPVFVATVTMRNVTKGTGREYAMDDAAVGTRSRCLHQRNECVSQC